MISSTKKIANEIELALTNYNFGNNPIELYEPLNYILQLGGKRLRPMLTLLAAKMYSDDWKSFMNQALAIEVFHNFTLMHDDIMDKAPLRRGQATVHKKWNTNIAILSGDVMLVKAYELLSSVSEEKLAKTLQMFNECAAQVCEGQQLDMLFEEREIVHEDEYIEMIRLKTAVLLGLSLKIGGYLAGASEIQCQNLYNFGVDIGIGFQIHDDLLDVFGDSEKVGKQVGGDILANKKTYLLIKALETTDTELKNELNNWINATDYDNQEKVNAVTEIYKKIGVDKMAESLRNDYFNKGLELFKKTCDSPFKRAHLKHLVLNLIGRDK